MTRVIRSWLFGALAMVVCQAALSAQAVGASTSSAQEAPAPATAPEALTASASDALVVLSWQAVEGATGYRVFRAVNAVWEPDPIASVSDTTYTNSGLTNGTTYAFAVAAYDTAGTGPRSIEVSATPAAPVEKQAAVTAGAGGGTPLARPTVQPTAEPAPAAQPTSLAPATAASQPTAVARTSTASQPTSLAGTTAVSQPAVAQEPAPTPAAESTPTETASPAPSVTVAPPPPTAAPAALAASGGEARATLSWQPVSGATGYYIFRATAGVWSPSPVGVATTTAYTNTGLTNGTIYTYRLAAYNEGGSGPQSAEVNAVPLTSPKGLKGDPGDTSTTVTWQASPGATTYTVYRSTSDVDSTFAVHATNLSALSLTDTGLTNNTRYYYRVRAHTSGGTSDMSAKLSVTPLEAPPADPPASLVAAPGNARVVLTWTAVAGATSYRVFRSTTSAVDRTPIATVTTLTFTNTGLTNGTSYTYQIAGRNAGGDGPLSAAVSATPLATPPAPAALLATGGDRQITLKWAASPGAATYNVYRGTSAGAQATTPVFTGVTGVSLVDTTIVNGPSYYYKVTALNIGGESPRSPETNAAGEAPPPVVDEQTKSLHRLLRQATWGARPGDVDHVKQVGVAGFLDEQLAMAPSEYPDLLFDLPIETTQEYFMQRALSGNDQLRQRVAWALHKIWVVSAVEVPEPLAIVTYYRLLMGGAFGNYRDLMRAVTLNPAMGRYLNMLNNRSQQITGVPPNENYPRELMQLFTLGLLKLNPNGTSVLDTAGATIPLMYSETDVKELARILSGWTFGDGNPATVPTRAGAENYRFPMEPVAAYHDSGAKFFLGHSFPANQTATQDLDQALDVIFEHANLAPFISRQLIQQLVTSNPSPAYVAAVAAVFNTPSARGDLAAVVRAILTHPEANASSATSGKLSEPVLFVVSPLRAIGATVTDFPFMSGRAETMGQKVFFPPSVFSYFSPGYRVRGTAVGNGLPLGGPEFQILTSVTALERANYIGSLLGGGFGDDVVLDLLPFTTRATDPAVLVDYCNLILLGGRMTDAERKVIIAAVRASSTTGSATERVRTAIYVTLAIAQSQVDR